MENKTVLQKDDTDKMKPAITPIEKKNTGNIMPEKVAKKNKESE